MPNKCEPVNVDDVIAEQEKLDDQEKVKLRQLLNNASISFFHQNTAEQASGMEPKRIFISNSCGSHDNIHGDPLATLIEHACKVTDATDCKVQREETFQQDLVLVHSQAQWPRHLLC